MKVQSFEVTQERKVLISLVMDDAVAAAVASKWPKGIGLFGSRWSNLVGSWCVQHSLKYGKAPRRGITAKFDTWSASAKGEEVEMIDRFLAGLSEEFDRDPDEFNSGQLLDLAGEHFNRVAISRLCDDLRSDLDACEMKRAAGRLAKWSGIQLGTESAKLPIADKNRVEAAFAERKQGGLVTYPGDAGIFFADQLDRGKLIAFLAPIKSWKSFFLHDVAWRAVTQKRNVVYFEAGDMSENQLGRRFYSRAAKHPHRSKLGKWPAEFHFPVAIESPEEENGTATVRTERKLFAAPLDAAGAWEACKRIIKKRLNNERETFRLSCNGACKLSVSDIENTLAGMSRNGFDADVVVVDYADILAAPAYGMEPRDQSNANWAALHSMAEELHVLVVTATQANTDAYKRDLLTRTNFSEDRRKLAHADGVVGINITTEERENNQCRLNWIVTRDLDFSDRQVLHVAGCMAISHPAMVSTF